MHRVHLMGISIAISLLVACSDDSNAETTTGDSATSETGASSETSGSETSTSQAGDGDGDMTTTGDGDGDPATGDGDGDSTTTGDGDGDGDGDSTTTGDGDGDMTTTGDGDGDMTTTGDGDGDMTTTGDGDGDVEPPNPLWNEPNLWYSQEDKLVYIKLDPADGSVVELVNNTITTPLFNGFGGITMLDDGSLLGSRVLEDVGTQIFYVAEPPLVQSEVEVEILGMVPDQLLIEALYTDCQGLVYLMDSGVDWSNAIGNRLIRFSGDYLGGDLSYEVITDLENAQVADIDDLGPGIDEMGEITDGTGFAIDSGTVYLFDYNTGTGDSLGMGGTYGSHALGGPLFDDLTARLYLLDIDAQLFEADPMTLDLSDVLVVGPPEVDAPVPGWSGLTGPLTECETTLPM